MAGCRRRCVVARHAPTQAQRQEALEDALDIVQKQREAEDSLQMQRVRALHVERDAVEKAAEKERRRLLEAAARAEEE